MRATKCFELYKKAKKEFSIDKFRNAIELFNQFIDSSNALSIYQQEKTQLCQNNVEDIECNCQGDFIYFAKCFAYKSIALCVTNQISAISEQCFDISIHFSHHFHCKQNNINQLNNFSENIIVNNENCEENDKNNEKNCTIKQKHQKSASDSEIITLNTLQQRNNNNTSIKITLNNSEGFQQNNEGNFHEISQEKLGKRKIENYLMTNQQNNIKKQKKGNYYKKFVKGLKEHYQNSAYRKAIIFFTQSIDLRNNFPSSYLSRGISNLVLDEYENAKKDFNKVIDLNPNHGIAYNNLGDTFSQLNDFPKSIEYYQISIEKNPNSSYVFFNRGVSYYSLGDYPMALKDFLHSLTLADSDDEITNVWIALSYERQNQFDLSIAYYEKANLISPTFDSFFGLGICNEKGKKFREAISFYSKAFELNGKSHECLNRIGICNWELSELSLALEYFRKAIESAAPIPPDHDYSWNLLEASTYFLSTWTRSWFFFLFSFYYLLIKF